MFPTLRVLFKSALLLVHSQRLHVNVSLLPSAALGIVTFLKGART